MTTTSTNSIITPTVTATNSNTTSISLITQTIAATTRRTSTATRCITPPPMYTAYTARNTTYTVSTTTSNANVCCTQN